MIRITVENRPDNGPVQELSIMEITEISSETTEHGDVVDYICTSVTRLRTGDVSIQKWPVRDFEKFNYPVWGLIIYCLAKSNGIHHDIEVIGRTTEELNPGLLTMMQALFRKHSL